MKLPKLTTLKYAGTEYFAVVEESVIIAFKDKDEAAAHFAEALVDFNQELLKSVEGTLQ